MRLVLISDAYTPMRTSAAVQVRDLAQECVRQGHKITVLVPVAGLGQAWRLDEVDGVEVLRVDAPRTKDVGYLRRTVAEFMMPYAMLRNFRRSSRKGVRWDGVIWYSPSIFLGPVARALKRASGCDGYLIVRDIFPEWAVDMGLMGRGVPYWFFKMVERYQYRTADTIGVQTPANVPYFDKWAHSPGHRVEVLQNWLAESPASGCSIQIAATPLAGKTIFVYAGNMGVAQGMDIVLDLASRLSARTDIGFLLVGRGSEVGRLRLRARAESLANVLFRDEIDPGEISGLYAQCHVGIVALDPRHRTHNIPGKFLSYMQAGIPVLAAINKGNDLIHLIEREQVGAVCTNHSAETLADLAASLVAMVSSDCAIAHRCLALSRKLFSPAVAVNSVTAALTERRVLSPQRGSHQIPVWDDGKLRRDDG